MSDFPARSNYLPRRNMFDKPKANGGKQTNTDVRPRGLPAYASGGTPPAASQAANKLRSLIFTAPRFVISSIFICV